MDAENKDKERTEYLQERRLLIDLQVDSARTLDRTILTLSGGALALSITFVNQIAPQPKSVWALSVAWGLFTLSLLLTLLSFLFSQYALDEALKDYDASYSNSPRNSLKNRYSGLTQKLNLFSVFSFVIAVSFLIFFAQFNVMN